MLRRFRETAPVGLVPLAWTFAAAAHLELLSVRTVLVGHVVMAVLLAGFALLSWREMTDDPVLRAWLGVVVVGFFLTLVGTAALATGGDPTLVHATVFGWMLLPAVALGYTGRRVPADARPRVYLAGGVLSGVGALAFLLATLAATVPTLAALALVGVGQTAGIVAAALD